MVNAVGAQQSIRFAGFIPSLSGRRAATLPASFSWTRSVLKPVREQASIFRFAARDRGLGSVVDLRCVPGLWPGVLGAGAVHHVAFRAKDDEEQLAARNDLVARGPQRQPSDGPRLFPLHLFSRARRSAFRNRHRPPGLYDRRAAKSLGQSLKLPEWLETRRFEIEALLPNIRPPMEIPGPNA